MAKAKTTAELGNHQAKLQARLAKKEAAEARKTARAVLSGKTYVSMSRADKDDLLLELCVKFGLVDDDGKGV